MTIIPMMDKTSVPPEPGASFGEVLRSELRQKGVTQEELARRTGLSPSGVSQIIRGKITPTLETVIVIEDALDLPRGTLAERLGYTAVSLAAGEMTPQDMFRESLARLPLTEESRQVLRALLKNLMDLSGSGDPPGR